MVNRPGDVRVEEAAQPGMQRIDAPEIDDRLAQRLAEQVARVRHQAIKPSTASIRCLALLHEQAAQDTQVLTVQGVS